MSDKAAIITRLTAVLHRWDELLVGKTEEDIIAPVRPGEWSVKDTLAHLTAWQQVSIARLDAARTGTTPVYPEWVAGADPDSDHLLHEFNARIYESAHDKPWSAVHHDWKHGFIQFLELGQAIPERDMVDANKYPWLNGHALLAVLQGSLEHHREHLDALREPINGSPA